MGKKTVDAAKLGTDAIPASRQKTITANYIASRLLRVSKTQRDREHARTTKMILRRKKRTLTVNQTLSRNFSLDELETALMSLKPGKAAGFDGIHPKFIKNVGAHVEGGFQHQLKTEAVFVDLTAAYDTVCREGLMIKFLEAVSCLKLFNLLTTSCRIAISRFFLVTKVADGERLNNGLPQRSVLAPLLFNLYMSDLPTFDECENSLETDIEVLNQFFHRWCLQPNPGKTEMCVFKMPTCFYLFSAEIYF
jgi:hypothetical protein